LRRHIDFLMWSSAIVGGARRWEQSGRRMAAVITMGDQHQEETETE
jgi:hypothetical protein